MHLGGVGRQRGSWVGVRRVISEVRDPNGVLRGGFDGFTVLVKPYWLHGLLGGGQRVT